MITYVCRTCTSSVMHGVRYDTWEDLGTVDAANLRRAWERARRRWPKRVGGVYALAQDTAPARTRECSTNYAVEETNHGL